MKNKFLLNGLVGVVALWTLMAIPSVHAEDAAVTIEPGQFDKAAFKLLKKAEPICVAGFRVAFIVSDKATAQASSALANVGNSTGTGVKTITQGKTSSVTVDLAGVSEALMVRIADQAYEKFMTGLAATGRPIIPAETIKASEGFKKLKLVEVTPGKPYTKQPKLSDARKFVVVSPSALPLWFTHFDAPYLGDQGPASLGNWRALNKLSADTKAVVIVPQITIDFAKLKSSGRTLLGSSAEVEAEAEMAIEAIMTSLQTYHAKIALAGDLATSPLQKAVAIPGAYGEMRSLSDSNDAALQNSVTLLTGFQGTQHFKSHKAVVADPAKFEALALVGIEAVNKAFLAAVQQAK